MFDLKNGGALLTGCISHRVTPNLKLTQDPEEDVLLTRGRRISEKIR